MLGYLNDHPFGKELFIRFPPSVFCERLTVVCVCVLLSLSVLRVG